MNDRPDEFYIPDNMNDGKHFLHIKNRNLIETVVMELAYFKIIGIIPFVLQVRIVICVIGALIIFFLGVFGIHGESLTEFIGTVIRFNKKRAVLHLMKAGQEDERTKNKAVREKKEDFSYRIADWIVEKKEKFEKDTAKE